MTLRISLPTDPKTKFNPGDEVTIGFKSYMLGDKRSELISFVVPNYPKRIDFVETTVQANPFDFETLANTEYSITNYSASPLRGTSPPSSELKLKVSPQPTRIKRNDLMNVTASVGALTALNGQNYSISGKDQKQPYVSIIVPRSLGITGHGAVSPGANKLTEIVKITKGKNYRIAVPPSYIRTFLFNDYVRDYLIFAYRQSTKTLTPSDKKMFVLDQALVVEFDPPGYSETLNANLKKRARYDFFADNANGNYIEFFVAVVRYVRSGELWIGDWLHKGPNGAPIWSKAKPV